MRFAVGFVTRVKEFGTEGPIVLSSLVLNLLGLLMPLAILLIFDRVIPFQASETLTLLTLILVISAGFEFGLRWCRSTILAWSAQRAAVLNHARFLSQILGARTVEFGKQSKPAILERYSAIAKLRDFYAGQNQALSIDLPFTAIFVVMIGLIGGWLVLVPLSAVALILVFAVVTKTTQSNVFGKRKTLDERRYSFLSEVLTGIVPVKANTMERQMTRRFEMLQKQSVTSSHQLIVFAGFAQNFSAVFSQVCVAAMGLWGACFVITQHIGIAELAACMMLNGRVVQPLMKLMTLWVQTENIAMQQAKLAEISAMPQSGSKTRSAAKLSGHISFSQVSLADDDRNERSCVTFAGDVTPGQIALIEAGEATSRLTTRLFDMLKGEQRPTAGEILIDGKPSDELVAARGEDGLVELETDPAIFHGTLIENLSGFGDTDQIELALECAEALGLAKRVNRLPFGYATHMGAGEHFERDPVNRQLIALIRAFSQHPKILLMNEPTAILDQGERDAFKDFLASLKDRPTIIVASPDPRIKGLADVILTPETEAAREIETWIDDAQSDRVSKSQRGAA